MEALARLSWAELAARTVADAARIHDAHADAVLTIDPAEHTRRRDCGLGAVTDRSLLHALMCLPLGEPVPVADLGRVTADLLAVAPPGVLDHLDRPARLRRCYTPAAHVDLIVVRAPTWHHARRRADLFHSFATRVVLLSRRPRRAEDVAWEADLIGAGLWVPAADGSIEELVAPAEHRPRYLKPGRWLFAEHAYAAWLHH